MTIHPRPPTVPSLHAHSRCQTRNRSTHCGGAAGWAIGNRRCCPTIESRAGPAEPFDHRVTGERKRKLEFVSEMQSNEVSGRTSKMLMAHPPTMDDEGTACIVPKRLLNSFVTVRVTWSPYSARTPPIMVKLDSGTAHWQVFLIRHAT